MIETIKHKLRNDEHLRELLKGSATTFILKITGMIFSYVVILLISKNFGAQGVGVFGVVQNLLTLTALIACLGLNASILRYVGEYNSQNRDSALSRVYKISSLIALMCSLILSIALFFFSDFISSSIFFNTDYFLPIKITALILPFYSISLINIEFIRGLKKLQISEFLRSVSRFLIIIFVLSIPMLNYDQLNPIFALSIGVILTALIGFLYVRRILLKGYPRKVTNEPTTNELMATSLPMMITTVSAFLLGSVGLFVLEHYESTKNVGVFDLCFKLSQIVILFLLVVNSISAPKFSELYWSGRSQELHKYLRQSSKILFIISILVCSVLFTFPNTLLSFFGVEFLENGTLILRILVLGQFLNAITGSVGVFMNMTGYQKMNRNITLLVAFISIITTVLLTKNFGATGTAIAVSGSIGLNNLIAAFLVRKKTGFSTFYNPFEIFQKF